MKDRQIRTFPRIFRKEIGGHVFQTDNRDCLLSYEGDGGEVTVPEGVKSIGAEAFALCNHVTGVILPEGVESIGENAFAKSGIRKISLPDSLVLIGKCAFSETPLESIRIPDQVTKLDEQAFYDAKRLRHIRLPEGLKSLNPGLFAGCVSLEEIELPKGLKHIEGKAFVNCVNLERITLPDTLVSVWVRAFEGCASLKEISLPDATEAVGYAAFRNCENLEKVRIPWGMRSFGDDVFEGDEKVELTGPGVTNGLVMIDHKICCFSAGLKKVVIPKGTKELRDSDLESLKDPEVFDLPRSLKYYSLQAFAQFASLKEIVTDRKALAAEIAFMLELKCTDRSGKPFTCQVPGKSGKWITEPDGRGGLILRGCKGRPGHTGNADFTTVVIPGEIKGMPVTGIGERAFFENSTADAFYIPDSVKHIDSKAFAQMKISRQGGTLFVRLPKDVRIAEDAFEDTRYETREDACRKRQIRSALAKPQVSKVSRDTHYAEAAADDPLIGTGTDKCPGLKANIWQYFDRLSREERVSELTHSFRIRGEIDGVGWASIDIEVDDESSRFRISYIGSSPADFRRFAENLGDGEADFFAWASEPGAYRWNIQRRGGILYVSAPQILKRFFIPREQFLEAVSGLTAEWRY